MLPELLAIQIHAGQVVRRSEMQERPDLTAFVIGKVPLIPDGAFVEQQCIPLRVPVTGDSEGTGSIEVVLNQVALVFGLTVLVEARPQTDLVGINNRIPVPIEIQPGAACKVRDQVGRRRRREGERCGEEQERDQRSHMYAHRSGPTAILLHR